MLSTPSAAATTPRRVTLGASTAAPDASRRDVRLLLFDLDGTLIRSNGVGRAALDSAFAERCGWEEATRGLSFAGATDIGIVRDVFARFGRSADEAAAACPDLLGSYLRHLEALLARSPGAVVTLTGVNALLAGLRARDDAVVGVLTGNVEGGARLKVAAAGLEWSFRVGAFGDEAPTRPDLLPLALERAAAVTGRSLQAERAVVIGDTPLDVAVARAHGARAVGVHTGFASREALAASRPDVLLDDLGATEEALAALLP